MKIGIDARWIFPEISGIGRYTLELIRGLAQVDRLNEYVLIFNDREVMERTMQDDYVADNPQFIPIFFSPGLFSIRSQLFMPMLIRRLGLNVFHAPNYMIPILAFPRGRSGRTRCVITLHDMIPLLFPEYTPKAKKTKWLPLFKRIMVEVGQRADCIIAPSESSRDDIYACLDIPPETNKVAVIAEGVDARFMPAHKPSRKEKTILYVGRFDPYKNVAGLVEAFAKVRKYLPEARLRIVGQPDARYPESQERAAELNLADAVQWQGYLSADELLDAYQQADVFALISLYEGFGLPVLEAMACGTPVICSNVSSLPEVVGDSALLVGPRDMNAIVDGLLSLLSDVYISDGYREKGLQRAALFNWTRTADKTIGIYNRSLEQP